MFAQVILSKANPRIDRIYDYSIPEGLKGRIEVGSQVLIPFGNRKDIGYVIGLTEISGIKNLKEIIDVTSPAPLFTKDSVEVAKWMSEYYMSYFISALRAIMPPGTRAKEHITRNPKRTKQKEQSIKTETKIGKPLPPTKHQKEALEIILPSIEKKEHETMLLFGVTGSGKTEVYLQAAAHALKLGKSSIILVPEVALTSHLIERFKERFEDHLSLLHSEMTIKEREENWLKVSSGYSKIILGTRSAVFAPAKDLGLIVLDEEYENTYKQEQNPRYHAREAAKFICEKAGATLVLGSATPSVETFYRAEIGEYKKVALPERIDEKPLPPVEVVDLKKEAAGGRGMLSKTLKEKIKKALRGGGQVILFMNRRGFFTSIICRDCGEIVRCPRCSSPLVFYLSDKVLKCNHCNFSASSRIVCPNCGGPSLRYFGGGTQRIENEVIDIFPEAKIVRIDRDTVSKRGSHEDLFASFKEGKANVLIGTQLVTKGLDVAAATVVGVVDADTALNLPDFRAAEHTFQLLTQVAGRAGRHSLPGEVVIQTYNPGHYAIKYAAAHDYEGFYAEEIKFRKALKYPPFTKMINLIVAGESEEKAKAASQALKSALPSKKDLEVLGPSEAPIKKLRGIFRWQILLKGEELDVMRKAVVESVDKVVSFKGVRVNVDVEPMNML